MGAGCVSRLGDAVEKGGAGACSPWPWARAGRAWGAALGLVVVAVPPPASARAEADAVVLMDNGDVIAEQSAGRNLCLGMAVV